MALNMIMIRESLSQYPADLFLHAFQTRKMSNVILNHTKCISINRIECYRRIKNVIIGFENVLKQ